MGIEAARSTRDVTDMLRERGRGCVASRIDYLDGLHAEDPDEPVLELESLRTLARLIVTESELPDPSIGLAPSRLAVGEWRIEPDGIVALEFLPSDRIRFACIGCRVGPAFPRKRLSGTLPRDAVTIAIREFTDQLR